MSVRSLAVGLNTPFIAPAKWAKMTLARRFAILALILALAGTFVLGAWVSNKIEQTARAREAGSAAIYMGHFISPLVQDLSSSDTLSRKHFIELDAVMKSAALRLRVVSIKIWNGEGRVIYSSNRETVGRVFPIEGALQRALTGTVASEFNAPGAESEAEFSSDQVLLEVYAPIRSALTNEIIAVAEFYEKADDLKAHLNTAHIQSWLVTAIVLTSIFLGFSTIIQDGSQTIERQRRELTQRIAQLSEAMARRKKLRERIERGARNVIEENERFRRIIGSELHDGPGQLIGFALLRLDAINGVGNEAHVTAVRAALRDAMRDIRVISAGLLLPDIESSDVLDCVRATIKDHEQKTDTKVALSYSGLPGDCPDYAKICLYRFIQEGLTNAFRHANGKDQSVSIKGDENGILVQVSDSGPGMPETSAAEYGKRLGLIGLRNRLESIRGTFSITSNDINRNGGSGTTISAWLPLGASGSHGT